MEVCKIFSRPENELLPILRIVSDKVTFVRLRQPKLVFDLKMVNTNTTSKPPNALLPMLVTETRVGNSSKLEQPRKVLCKIAAASIT